MVMEEIKFDEEYFYRMRDWLQTQDGQVYDLADIEESEKLVFHLKFYIETRTAEDAVVEFNSLTETEIMYGAPYTQFRILEFFEGKIKDKTAKINEMHQKAKNEELQKRIQAQQAKMQTVTSEQRTKGLFQ